MAQGLVARGAQLIDADAIVKELQEPGGVVFHRMVDHFGERIVGPDGLLDRQAVAEVVFADEAELKALNDIVHPAVGEEMKARQDALRDTDAIVVLDIPLLVRADGTMAGRKQYQHLRGIVVVDCDAEVAVERLVVHRGFDQADARARIANQASREDRLAVADHIIDNSGTLDALEPQLDACWAWMGAVAATPRSEQPPDPRRPDKAVTDPQ